MCFELVNQLGYAPYDDRFVFLDRGGGKCTIPDLPRVCVDLHVARANKVALRYSLAALA